MIKILSTAFVVLALSAASASAAPCKDAKGKFAKCGTPGAVAVKPK